MPKFSIFLDLFSNSNENKRFPTLSEEELANLGSENQNQNTSKSTNLAELIRKCSVAKRESWKIFLAMSYGDAILCRFFAEILNEDGDEYEPDSGKENARFKKL